jgi:hypothetical protein
MIESLILIEGESVKEEGLNISLMNAKQLIKGNVPGMGIIVHIAANSPEDLQNALIEFTKVPEVKGVVTMIFRSI